jgi:hypothetical protein
MCSSILITRKVDFTYFSDSLTKVIVEKSRLLLQLVFFILYGKMLTYILNT